MKRCIGFGDKSGKCENPPGTKWSPYWCEECNKERLGHISKRMANLQEQFKVQPTKWAMK